MGVPCRRYDPDVLNSVKMQWHFSRNHIISYNWFSMQNCLLLIHNPGLTARLPSMLVLRWPHTVRAMWNQGVAVLEVSCPKNLYSPYLKWAKNTTQWKRHPGFKQKCKNKDVMLILRSLGDKQDMQSRYFCLSQVKQNLVEYYSKKYLSSETMGWGNCLVHNKS